MNTLHKSENKKYSYADYLTFPDDVHVEIIDGVIYKTYGMSPAPRRFHQEISVNLCSIIWTYLKDKKCNIFSAPFDVVFTEKKKNNSEICNVVQPDISIICDKNKLDEFGCKGSPDWIIEILSPATASKDLKEKLKLYEKYGVKEYWIIDPIDMIVTVFILINEKYNFVGFYDNQDFLSPTIFTELTIDLAEVFGVERIKKEVSFNEEK